LTRRLASVAWLGVLVAAVLALARADEPALTPPPPSPGGWAAWASGRTPVEAAAAVLRIGALAAAGYLLALTVLGLVAVLLRRRRAAELAARLSPAVVRWFLGAWLAGSLAAGPAAAAGSSPPPTMVLLPHDEPPPAPAPAPAPSPPPVPAVATITLAPGDHLWSVAARTLAMAWGRVPAELEVAPYWRLLVELNRARLPNPADPDLVFPGDVLQLPPVPR
jgi:nucleoid-associated protein YgaU